MGVTPVAEPPAQRARIHVLIVNDFAEDRGGATTLLNSFIAGDAGGLHRTVVALNPGPLEAQWRRRAEVITLNAGRLRSVRQGWGTIQGLSRVLRERRPDLVLSWMPKAHVYTAQAARWAGVADRLVWWQSGGPADPVDRMATMLPARAVFAYSRASADQQEQLWPHRPTVAIEPGIELPPTAAIDEVVEARQRFDVPADRFVVGIVGRLQSWKGQDRLLEAVARLRANGRDVHVLIVGGNPGGLEPEYELQLRALVSRLGLDDVVAMTGQVQRPAPLLALMDVMVNASEAEPFGLVLLEAMAAGVPVIAADAGGPSDLITNGSDGLLMPDASAGSIAAAVAELMDDPRRRTALARRAERTVRERYLAAHFVARVETALTHVYRGVSGLPALAPGSGTYPALPSGS